jgi:hypothetical protein
MASIILRGQKVGRIKASFLLAAESFRFLKADPEMLFLPIIGFFINIALWIPAALIVFFGPVGGTLAGFETAFGGENEPLPAWWYAVVFYGFFTSAFSVAFVQAGVAHLVSTRARGKGDTLRGALHVVFSLLPALLLWSLITATVGFVLRQIAERSKLLMRIVVFVVGAVWSVLTYFVIPALVIERQPTVASIKRSGKVFKDTWGETIVANISLSGFFMIIFLSLFVLYIGAAVALLGSAGDAGIGIFIGVTVLFVFALFILSLINSTLSCVLRTLLFIYATEGNTVTNFDTELLANMLVKKNQVEPVAMQTPAPPVTN